jgi:hypothetical protein
MKKLHLVLVIALSLFVSAFSVGDQKSQSLTLYDFKSKSTAAITFQPLGSVRNLFGTKKDVDFGAFAGLDQFGRGSTGLALTAPFKIAENANLVVGGSYRLVQNQEPQFGLLVGVQFRF